MLLAHHRSAKPIQLHRIAYSLSAIFCFKGLIFLVFFVGLGLHGLVYEVQFAYIVFAWFELQVLV